MTKFSIVTTILLIGTFSSAPSSRLYGDVYEWITPVDGQFSTSSNWSNFTNGGSGTPNVDDVAVFGSLVEGGRSNPYQVAFAGNVVNIRSEIRDYEVTWEMNSGRYEFVRPEDSSLAISQNAGLTVENGTVDITGGGYTTVFGGDLILNSSSTLQSVGDVHVMGSFGDEGQLRVTDGSQVILASGLYLAEGGNALVEGDGTELSTGFMRVGQSNVSTSTNLTTSSLVVSQGAATHVAGQSVISGINLFGFDTQAEVEVRGANSSWNNGSTLFVGTIGEGRLTVSEGAALSTHGAVSATIGNGQGHVSIQGANSSWTYRGQLHIGMEGEGHLAVTDGASVRVPASAAGLNTIGFIGTETGSIGTATVSGSGSTWTNPFDQLIVGNLGDGVLSITDGGRVTSAGSNSISSSSGVVGGRVGGNGVAIISGIGSRWDHVDGAVVVGFLGQGSMEVSDGGQLDSQGGFIGREVGSSGTVTVHGEGSQWISDLPLRVALDEANETGGTGALDVSQGGRVVAPLVRIGVDGLLQGDGVIVGDVINAGTTIPGNSPGVLSIQGGFTQLDSGSLQLEIGGLLVGEDYDQLKIEGDARIEGALSLSFIDDFAPSAGEVFELIDASPAAQIEFDLIEIQNLEPGFQFTTALENGAFRIVALNDGVILRDLTSDFDNDGDVDGDDFLVWQAFFPTVDGTGTSERGDANGDGNVDGEDFLVWQSEFGSNSRNVAQTAIPEPNTVLSLLFGFLATSCGSARRGGRPYATETSQKS